MAADMTSPPVNVKLEGPTIDVDEWQRQAAAWRELNRSIGGHPEFYPLTIKAAYVIGIVHSLCESVELLLKHPRARQTTYMPAYGVFASGIELIGRCINGNPRTSGSSHDLSEGFRWILHSPTKSRPQPDGLITTDNKTYNAEQLVALRHFAAHGQASMSAQRELDSIDCALLGIMPPLVAAGLERYWSELLHHNDACNRLAKANVIAFREWNVYKTWLLLERDITGRFASITEIFERFDWRID